MCAVVIDNGSNIRAGFAGEMQPQIKFPSIIGYSQESGDTFIGNEAQANRDNLTLKRPIDAGLVTNWDDMEKIWRHTFSKLNVHPQHQAVLLTQIPLSSHQQRQKTAQVMFEQFNLDKMYVAAPSVLSLYAAGLLTGLVLDIGDTISLPTLIYEGHALPHSILRLPINGRDLTFYLMDALKVKYEEASEIKEKCCYVPNDTTEEVTEVNYKLPDGNTVTVKNERCLCPEALFNPNLLDREFPGLHETLFNAIMKCDIDLRRGMYKNVILAGGSTMFPGFPERLQREIANLAPSTMEVRVKAAKADSAWIGGSLLASLSSMDNMWITKQEYEEHGPSIVLKKCF